MEYTKALLFLVIGFIALTLIQLTGAIIAKKTKMKHSQLINFSAIVYFSIGYYAAESYSLVIVLAITALLALYESLVAFKFAFKINPNPQFTEISTGNSVTVKNTITQLIVSLIVASVGFLVSKI